MERLTRISLRFPWIVLTALAAVTIGLGAGLPSLRTEVGYRAFLGSEHPAVQRFDHFLERFGGGLTISAVWSCAETPLCSCVFDPGSLRMAARVAAALERVPGVRRVDSPATSPLMVSTPGGVDARRFVVDGVLTADRHELAAQALRDPTWIRSLVSEDGQVGAIVAQLSSSDSNTSVRVFDALQGVLRPYEDLGFQFHRVGGPVEFVVAGGELQRAARHLIPLMVTLIGLILWILFRSVSPVIAVLGTIGVAVLWTMGALAWAGWSQNSISQTLPPIVLVIGVCDAIHLLVRYAEETRAGFRGGPHARRSALRRAAADVGPPCLVTSVTTAGGLVSFVTSDLESFAQYGLVAAFGVLAALLLTFTLLPILLLFLPARSIRTTSLSERWDQALHLLLRIPRRAPRAVLIGALGLAGVSGLGIVRLNVDAAFEDLYGEESQVVRWVDFVDQHLRKPDTLEIEVVTSEAQRLELPSVAERIRQLSESVSTIDGLGHAHSILDFLASARRALNEERSGTQPLGKSAAENAQLLLLLSMNDRDQVNAWLSSDHRHVRLSVESGKEPQQQLRSMLTEVEEYVTSSLPQSWQKTVTGPLVVVHEMIEEIKATQLSSFTTAAGLVLVIVALSMRSIGVALLAMVPAGLPVLVTLGIMGLSGIHLDVGTSMVAAIVVGIAVDDGVHLLTQFRRERAAGFEASAAMERAAFHVGRALVTTSVALSVGFFAFSASPWKSVANFGVVASIAILAALVAVLVVLPALIQWQAPASGRSADGRIGMGSAERSELDRPARCLDLDRMENSGPLARASSRFR